MAWLQLGGDKRHRREFTVSTLMISAKYIFLCLHFPKQSRFEMNTRQACQQCSSKSSVSLSQRGPAQEAQNSSNTIQWGAQLSLARADKLNNNFSLDSLTKSPRDGREIALIQIKTDLSARNMGQCEEETGDTSEHLHSAWCRTHWWWCRGVRPCVDKNSEFTDRVKGQELL